MFKPRQRPKSLTADASGKKILNIIPHLIICHRTFNNVVQVSFTVTAGCHKVQPFISHLLKYLDFQIIIRDVFISAYYMRVSLGHGPSLRLTLKTRAIKSKAEVFVVAYNTNFRILHHSVRSVIDDNGIFFCHTLYSYAKIVISLIACKFNRCHIRTAPSSLCRNKINQGTQNRNHPTNGLSKSFRSGWWVSLALSTASPEGMRQSIPSEGSRMLMPPSASG